MKLLVLDRDGVINEDSPEYIKAPEEWFPIPGSIEAIAEQVDPDRHGVGRGAPARRQQRGAEHVAETTRRLPVVGGALRRPRGGTQRVIGVKARPLGEYPHVAIIDHPIRSARVADDIVVEHGLDSPTLRLGIVR